MSGYKLTVHKANRQPVGIHIREELFTNNIIQLQKDDLIYIFSDGYADQLGGQSGTKFMSKNFKNLLIEIADKPIEEQKEILNINLKKWKGKHEQNDDILVIGMKI